MQIVLQSDDEITNLITVYKRIRAFHFKFFLIPKYIFENTEKNPIIIYIEIADLLSMIVLVDVMAVSM